MAIKITECELKAAMDGYAGSDWGKSQNFPLLGFLKDPHSWIAMATSGTTPQALPVDPTRDFVAEWNAAVPAMPTEWHGTRSPVRDLATCAADPDFYARFAEVCQLAQKAHVARGGDVSWLTFEWIIREKDGRVGWWRLLTDLKGTTIRTAPKTKFEQHVEDSRLASEIISQQQAQLRQRMRERPPR
jgi:hypothetical protein